MSTGPNTPPPPSGPKAPLWDKHDLAAYLGLGPDAVAKMITKRACPTITWVGRNARFDPADVTAWVEAQKEKAPTVKPGLVGLPGGRAA